MNQKVPFYKKLWVQVIAGLFVVGAVGSALSPTGGTSDSGTVSPQASVEDSQKSVESELPDDEIGVSEGSIEGPSTENSNVDSSTSVDVATGAEPSEVAAPKTTTGLASLISGLTVAPEVPDGYNRDLFKHWTDADGDGCNTRYEVLIEESVTAVNIGSGCQLSGGTWVSAFDLTKTTDPSKFDVDHFVPLKEAWDSGAWAWDAATREAYANDLDYEMSLIAVSASSNRSKSDRDPTSWLPTNEGYWCEYITAWVQVKTRWGLSVDGAEKSKLDSVAKECKGVSLDFAPKAVVETPSQSEASTQTPSPTASSTSTPSPSSTPAPTQTATGNCSIDQVDINSANWDDLQLIIHIGPERADEIVSMRSARKFTSVDGLDAISGIGPSRLKDIKAQNIACVN